jgi:putative ABC transport system permease protein
MIAGGFSAIVVFQGFGSTMIENLRNIAIDNQFGHMQIAKNKFWNPVAEDTIKDRSLENPEAIKAKLLTDPKVDYVSGRMTFFGLLSSGDRTVSAQFIGFDPAIETRMRDGLTVFEGKNFSKEGDNGNVALAGKGIIKQIGGEVGQDLTILAHTYDGVINAMDIKLQGKFVTTFTEIDDSTIYLPLKVAQKLLDTDRVERLVVLFKKEKYMDKKLATANEFLPKDATARSWISLSTMFRQVVEYYDVQNRIIEVIILTLVLLSISNTVGMSIFERTGEIGTLRAIGDTSLDIIKNFTVESIVLGILGSLTGCGMGFLLSLLINAMKVLITMPGASVPIQVDIAFIPGSYLYAACLTTLATVLATYFPARKISKLDIVEALRHNI